MDLTLLDKLRIWLAYHLMCMSLWVSAIPLRVLVHRAIRNHLEETMERQTFQIEEDEDGNHVLVHTPNPTIH